MNLPGQHSLLLKNQMIYEYSHQEEERGRPFRDTAFSKCNRDREQNCLFLHVFIQMGHTNRCYMNLVNTGGFGPWLYGTG